MALQPLQLLIICPLVFLGGFVDAIAGGGGLITLPAYMIAGLPVHQAIGTNKMSSSMGCVTATVRYARDGFIPYRQVPFYVLCALAGSAAGARIALMIDENTFQILMLVILPLTAYYVLKKKDSLEAKEPLSARKTLLTGMAVALLVGMYDGFYGPGTGTFLILLLTGLARLSLQEANGVTKVINTSSNLGALAVFITSGTTLVLPGMIAGLFSIAGNLLGAKLFTKGGAKVTRPIMLTVLAIFFVRIVSGLVVT